MNPENIKLAWTTDGAIAVIKDILLRPHARGNGKSVLTGMVDAALCTAVIALENSKWISVKDRLPEYEAKVLCCAKYDGKPVIFQNQYLGGDIWLSDTSHVTHWMPLPEPPEEETEDE